MKHSYENEGIISGDVVNVNKELKTIGNYNKGYINYAVLLRQEKRYKEEIKEKFILINFFRNDESEELNNLKEGDNILVYFNVFSNKSKDGRYFSNINGSKFIMLIPAEDKTQQTTKDEYQQNIEAINNSVGDDDIPF